MIIIFPCVNSDLSKEEIESFSLSLKILGTSEKPTRVSISLSTYNTYMPKKTKERLLEKFADYSTGIELSINNSTIKSIVRDEEEVDRVIILYDGNSVNKKDVSDLYYLSLVLLEERDKIKFFSTKEEL